MLREEAAWIRDTVTQLEKGGQRMFPLANIGCSDTKNTENQPWIGELNSFLKQHGTTYNIDIKSGSTIDISGDLLDEKFVDFLQAMKFECLICANVLANIRDKEKLINALLKIVKPGGFLIITVSNRYPYMADPVDTLFRPSTTELFSLFLGSTLVGSALISGDTYAKMLSKRKKLLFITIGRMLVPFYKFKTWINLIKYIPSLYKPVRTSCIVIQKGIKPEVD